MRDNILRYLRKNELIAPGATLVCAVSGAKLASERSVVSSRSSAMSFIFLSVIFITVTIIARTAQIVKLTEAANKCIIGINRAKE